MINLCQFDFIIVKWVCDEINSLLGFGVVCLMDVIFIVVIVFRDFLQWVMYLLVLENLEIKLVELLVKIIINFCIGIIVIGSNVKVLLVVVIYGNLMVIIFESVDVSQVNVFVGGGQMVVVN